MLLLLSALLVLQTGDAPPRDTLRADSAVARGVDSTGTFHGDRSDRVPGSSLPRLAVTDEVRRTAFRNAGARELLMGARVARLASDSLLRSYDAKSVIRISAGLGFRRLGRQRLLFRAESAARVRWQRDVGARIELTGQRAVFPAFSDVHAGGGVAGEIATELKEDLADEGVDDAAALNVVPYFPGSESILIGLGRARGEADPDRVVHPLATGAEAYYTYERGDSIVVVLPPGRRTRLIELRVRPRRPHWRLIVGSVWLDGDTKQLVRAAYRLSAAFDLWQVIEEEEGDDDDIPAPVRAAMTPMTLNATTVALEYGMHEGRFWLPRAQTIEGSMELGMIRVPVDVRQSFTYGSVNGPEALPSFVVADRRAGIGEGLASDTTAADSSAADSSAADSSARRAYELSVSLSGPMSGGRARHPQCETSSVRTRYERRHGGAVPVQIVVPCDTVALAASPDLPASIFDEGDALFSAQDLDVIRDALDISAQPEWEPQPPQLLWGLSRNLVRYNRVEALSAGVGAVQALGAGYGAEAFARIGVGDWQPNGEVALARSNGRDSLRLAVAHRLVAANDWGTPFALGPSLNALLFGRDDALYYRTLGVELGGSRRLESGVLDWRLFAERQRGADVETNFSVPHLFAGTRASANIDAARAREAGLAVRHLSSFGLDPRGWRLLGDLRLEAATGTFDYSRAALDVTVGHAILGHLDGALTAGAGTTGGLVPPQRLYYLGGSRTVRGQIPGIHANDEGVGDAYWLGRLELGLGSVAARPVVFGDIGWAGGRRDFGTGRPISGAGVGFSIMDGLIRFDLAHGIRPRQELRADLYLEASF